MVVSGDLYFLFLPDGTDGETITTISVATVDTAGIEVDVPRSVRVTRMEGRRPVEAEGLLKKDTVRVPVTRGRKENAVPVRPRRLTTFDSVLRRPRPGTSRL